MPSATASRKLTEQRCPVTFTPALVRLLDRRAELGAADVGVGLEPGGPFRRPVGHEPARRLR